MEIEILGTGCANCRSLEERTREVLERTGTDATVEKVEEMADIVSYGVMGLPALVVDGEVVLSGRVPDPDELVSLLQPRG
jgi:small redox-active disulfide protein 2